MTLYPYLYVGDHAELAATVNVWGSQHLCMPAMCAFILFFYGGCRAIPFAATSRWHTLWLHHLSEKPGEPVDCAR